MDKRYKIAEIKVSIVKTQSAGADYTDHAAGHWINDSIIANPMWFIMNIKNLDQIGAWMF